MAACNDPSVRLHCDCKQVSAAGNGGDCNSVIPERRIEGASVGLSRADPERERCDSKC